MVYPKNVIIMSGTEHKRSLTALNLLDLSMCVLLGLDDMKNLRQAKEKVGKRHSACLTVFGVGI